MKVTYLKGLLGMLLLLIMPALYAGLISKVNHTHTISFNDNQAHTLLETPTFSGGAIFAASANRIEPYISGDIHVASPPRDEAIILFNAECNVDANEAGVWLGIDTQVRSQNANHIWGEWHTVDSSNNNSALCSAHGDDAPVVRVKASIHTIHRFDPNTQHQIRVQGRLREGSGTASVDDMSLMVTN